VDSTDGTRTPVIRFPCDRICRMHQRNKCPYGAECNNVHICREYWASKSRRKEATGFVTPSTAGSPPEPSSPVSPATGRESSDTLMASVPLQQMPSLLQFAPSLKPAPASSPGVLPKRPASTLGTTFSPLPQRVSRSPICKGPLFEAPLLPFHLGYARLFADDHTADHSVTSQGLHHQLPLVLAKCLVVSTPSGMPAAETTADRTDSPSSRSSTSSNDEVSLQALAAFAQIFSPLKRGVCNVASGASSAGGAWAGANPRPYMAVKQAPYTTSFLMLHMLAYMSAN
jgi:hypothetical protein